MKKLLRIVRPSYEYVKAETTGINIPNPLEKKLGKEEVFEEKKEKPREKLSQTLQKLHAISQQYYQKEKEVVDFSNFEKFRNDEDEETDQNNKNSSKQINKNIEEESSKQKVYGVSSKPKPRNLKEKDVEKKKGIEDVNWMPPKGQRGDGKTSLNDKFGY